MTIALLLKHGAAVDVRNHQGRTPLLIATDFAEEAALPCVRLLVDAAANVNATDAYGSTALMAAAEGGQEQVVTVLLKAGADTSIRDRQHRTAAMLCGSMGTSCTGMPAWNPSNGLKLVRHARNWSRYTVLRRRIEAHDSSVAHCQHQTSTLITAMWLGFFHLCQLASTPSST